MYIEPVMDPTFPLVPIANIVACILVALSVSENMLQSWNVGACSFAVWIVAQSLIMAIDTIIWSNNTNNIAPVWCDIGIVPRFTRPLTHPTSDNLCIFN